LPRLVVNRTGFWRNRRRTIL